MESSTGSTKEQFKRRWGGTRIPWETGSTRFTAEGTYTRRIVMLWGISKEEIQWMQSLCGTFCEHPLANAPMMPVLSPLTLTSLSDKDSWTTQRTASSRVIDLAHPMSLPPDFQPSRRHHAAHLWLTMIPIPQMVDTSTHMSGSWNIRGTKEHEPPCAARTDLHHLAHSITKWGTWCFVKSLGNFNMKTESRGSVERPSQNMKWCAVRSHAGMRSLDEWLATSWK